MVATDVRRVWVGCLACYNGGELVGDWCEPAAGPDWRCANPSHEETWVFDHEGFGPECEGSPVFFAELADRLSVADECGIPADVARSFWLERGADADLSDGFYGVYESLRDLVCDWLDEGMFGVEVSALWRSEHPGWVDVGQIVTDLECGGDLDVYRHDGLIFVWSAS